MGQAHGEDRALRLVGANVDGPAMTEDDLLHDEEPEPETVIRCRRGGRHLARRARTTAAPSLEE